MCLVSSSIYELFHCMLQPTTVNNYIYICFFFILFLLTFFVTSKLLCIQIMPTYFSPIIFHVISLFLYFYHSFVNVDHLLSFCRTICCDEFSSLYFCFFFLSILFIWQSLNLFLFIYVFLVHSQNMVVHAHAITLLPPSPAAATKTTIKASYIHKITVEKC